MTAEESRSGTPKDRAEESTPVSRTRLVGTVPLTTATALAGTAGLNLSARERETVEGLEQLDRHLAGLYRLGLELSPRVAEPGVAYLIAHAGRELGLGVVRMLSGVAPAFTEEELERVARDETYRAEIARMLGVAPDHASVTIWFRTQRTLVRTAHFRLPAPSPDAVRDAFRQLSGLLFGRVAPYFSTHAELEALLVVPEPTPDQLARVRELLLRPVQRHHFFGKLQHSAWLQPLADAGYFTAPDLAVDPDGVRRPRPWPEGEFLVRVARADSERVVQLLLAIPRENQNPIVWDVVARAALALPTSEARRLIRPLTRAVRALPAGRFFAHHLIDLTRALAESGEPRAFELAECLLWLASGPPPGEMVEVTPPTDAEGEGTDGESASVRAALARSLRRGRRDTEWMLDRLDAYGLSQFIQKALPALEALDAGRLLELIAAKLERAAQLARLPEQEESSAPAAGAEEAVVGAADAHAAESPDADPRDESEYWADHLDHAQEGGDVRTQLAVALAGIASRTAGRDAAGAQLVDKALARRRTDVFTRIRFVALRAAGEFAPRPSLDALIGDPMVIDPPFGAREAAAFLRAQFERASPDAQRRFLATLERGPEPDLVERMVEFRRGGARSDGEGEERAEGQNAAETLEDAAANDAEARDVIADWQRRRLRWFHDQIPEVLKPLADALEVSPRIPSARDQALDEVGSWSSGVSSVGYRSPTTISELGALSPEAVVEHLRTWRPEAGASPFERPSVEGLELALTSLVTEHPTDGEAIARLLPGAGIAPGYIAAVLAGFEALAKEGRLPWRALVALVEFVLSEADRALASAQADDAVTNTWRSAVYLAVDVLREACSNNAVPEDSHDDVWRLASAAIRSPITWSELHSSARTVRSGAERREEGLGDLEFGALNSLPGHAVRMLVDVALWDYRRAERLEGSTEASATARARGERADEVRDASETAPRLVPLLESVLEQTGRPGRLARTMLGDFIPQLVLLARRWVLDHAETLFEGGATTPGEHPTWGAYLARGGFYELVFRDLRAWYVRAADAAPDPTPGSERSDWSVSRNLAEHIVIAIVRGAAAVGDDDQLVERVFTHVRIEDRAHAYWSIFRGWSDAKAPVPEEFVERLVAFWEWRVSVLEGQPESDERADEADGLGWFLVTPYVAPTEAIRLGLRTLRLASDDRRTGGSAWERLGELARHDSVGTFELVELLSRRALASDYPYLPYPQVALPLRAALSAENGGTRVRARRLINDLGERGLLEFGELLNEASPEPEET